MILAVLAATSLMVEPPLLRLDTTPPICEGVCDYASYVIRLGRNGSIVIDGRTYLQSQAPAVLKASRWGADAWVVIESDSNTAYGQLTGLMTSLKLAGFRHMVLVEPGEQ